MAAVGTMTPYQVMKVDPYSNNVTNKSEVVSFIHQNMSSARLNPSNGTSECRELKFAIQKGNKQSKAKFAAFMQKDGKIQVRQKVFECYLFTFTWQTNESRRIEKLFNTADDARALKAKVSRNPRVNKASIKGSKRNETGPKDFPCHMNLDQLGCRDELMFSVPTESKCRTLRVLFDKARGTQPLMIENNPLKGATKYKWGFYYETKTELKLDKEIRLDCRQSINKEEAKNSDPEPVRLHPGNLLTKQRMYLKFTFTHNEDKSITLKISED